MNNNLALKKTTHMMRFHLETSPDMPSGSHCVAIQHLEYVIAQ